MNTRAESTCRLDAENALAWAIPQVSFLGLSDQQVHRIHAWAEKELRNLGWCHVPGVSFVRKERRLGKTNRLGWRWVVYVGCTTETAHEAAVCNTRQVARKKARSYHAAWWAEHGTRWNSGSPELLSQIGEGS